MESGVEVVPVFVFDERVFQGETKFGFKKTNRHRAQFIIESVEDLRNSLKKLGSDLIIRVGKPEEEIFNIAQKIKSSWVFCNRERTKEEVAVQDALENKLWSIGHKFCKDNRIEILNGQEQKCAVLINGLIKSIDRKHPS